MEKTGFLEDAPGQRSSGRLVFVCGSGAVIIILFLLIILKAFYKLEMTWTEYILVGTFLGGLFISGKLIQNSQEKTTTKA